MTHRIEIEAVHAEDPDTLFRNAMAFDELQAAMAGLARYERLPVGGVVEEGADYDIAVTLWGWVRTPHHHIHVDRMDPVARRCQSRERNAMVARWDHEIAIDPHPAGATWRDTILLDAGWRTPVVARICRHTYAYRHRARAAQSISTRLTRL